MVNKRSVWVWILTFMLTLQILQLEQVYSESYNQHEWTFEINEDGSIHVQVKITAAEVFSSYWLTFGENWTITNMVSWGVETGKPIMVTRTEEDDIVKYTFDLGKDREVGFQFICKFDLFGKIKEVKDINGAFYFFTKSGEGIEFKATVILPKDHELLYTYSVDPDKVSYYMGRTSVLFVRKDPGSEEFPFGVAFSKKGVESIEEGENKFNLGQYDEAIVAYEEAIEFYSQLPEYYGKDLEKFLTELHDRIIEINDTIQREADKDGDGYLASEDCNDSDPGASPGVQEACDQKDNDCDGEIDEGFDKDNDGYTECNGDCNDNDPQVHPGAQESCGEDYNCDGHIDSCLKTPEIIVIGGLFLFSLIIILLIYGRKRKSKTLTCPACRNKIEKTWASCPHCGADLKSSMRVYDDNTRVY